MQTEITFDPTKEFITKKTVTKEIIREVITIEEITIPSNSILKVVYPPSSHNMDVKFNDNENVDSAKTDDCEFRKEFAKLLNIDLSKKDSNAFSQLYGSFDDIFSSTETVDVTEWIRKLRRRK